ELGAVPVAEPENIICAARRGAAGLVATSGRNSVLLVSKLHCYMPRPPFNVFRSADDCVDAAPTPGFLARHRCIRIRRSRAVCSLAVPIDAAGLLWGRIHAEAG